MRAAHVSSEALLLDRHGVPLRERRVDPRVRRLDWVPLGRRVAGAVAALIAAEDRRFLEHHGVDWQALAGAAWDSIWRTLDGRRGAAARR